jgi:hypothetical protein
VHFYWGMENTAFASRYRLIHGLGSDIVCAACAIAAPLQLDGLWPPPHPRHREARRPFFIVTLRPSDIGPSSALSRTVSTLPSIVVVSCARSSSSSWARMSSLELCCSCPIPLYTHSMGATHHFDGICDCRLVRSTVWRVDDVSRIDFQRVWEARLQLS